MPQQTMHNRQAVMAIAHPPLQKRLSLLVSAVLLGSLPFGIAQAADGIQDLGVLGSGKDGPFSMATGVNADGSVVVGLSSSSGSNDRAFRWTQTGGMVSLNTLPGGNFSMATGVNADGNVVVGWSTTTSARRAFRWVADNSGGTMTALPTLGGSDSFANAVNANGNIVVGDSQTNGDTASHAFRWVVGNDGINGTMTDLGTLATGSESSTDSAAFGINANGNVVVGHSDTSGGNTHAFRWVVGNDGINGTMTDLRTLGGNNSTAHGVNANGNIVVGESDTSGGDTHAFRWVVGNDGINGTMTDLRTLGGSNSAASAVNADGSVVVGSSDTTNNVDQRAFRWTDATGMQSVEQWLAANGVAVGNIQTSFATGVNADGNVVVGALANRQAFIARVTPSTPTQGSGLITLDDVSDSLSSSIAGLDSALGATALVINGAHSHPLSRKVEKGQKTVWVAGDSGQDKHNNRDGDVGLYEIGAGYNFGKAQVNVSLGKTRNKQKTLLGGSTTNKGDYAMVEAIVPLSEKHKVYATVGAFQHKGDVDNRRAYLNAGLPDSSNGKASTKTKGVRVRVDWEDAAKVGKTSLTPYADFSQSKAHMDGFTETGGGFPARFDARDEKATEARIGVNGSTDLNNKVKLLTNLEAAHRFEKKGAATSGNLVGLFGFNLDGKPVKRDWLKAGVGLEGKVGKNGKASLMLNTTTNSSMPKTWVAASYQIDF